MTKLRFQRTCDEGFTETLAQVKDHKNATLSVLDGNIVDHTEIFVTLNAMWHFSRHMVPDSISLEKGNHVYSLVRCCND